MLSICYIIKNEAEFLEKSLESVQGLATDYHFLDTGSTDGSLEILDRFSQRQTNCQIYQEAWRDDFAWARNWVAEKAKGPWVLFIDGDEILDRAKFEQHMKLLETSSSSVFSLIQRNYSRDSSLAHSIKASENPIQGLKSPLYFFDNWMERLFRKDSKLQYEGRIHESLLPACRRLGLEWSKLDVVLHHYGRLKNLDAVEKSRYYLKLTKKKLEAEPDNPAAWIELIRNHNELQQNQEAFQLAQEALTKFPSTSAVLKAAIEACLHSDHFADAEELLEVYLDDSPDDQEALTYLSSALLFQGKFDESEKVSKNLLSLDSKNFAAELNLGIIFFEKKEWPLAKQHLERALELKPHDQFIQDALRKIPSSMR